MVVGALQYLRQVLYILGILPVVVAVPCVLVALLVFVVYIRNASTSHKTRPPLQTKHLERPAHDTITCCPQPPSFLGLVMEIPMA